MKYEYKVDPSIKGTKIYKTLPAAEKLQRESNVLAKFNGKGEFSSLFKRTIGEGESAWEQF